MQYAYDIPKFLDWVIESWAPVAVLADRAAYSRSHFSRLMSRATGEGPGQLRKRLQLEAGAHLLRTTSLSVGEIAVEIGYSTPEAFTKAFRSGYGLAPRDFRGANTTLWLGTETGIHFHPNGLVVRRQGNKQMNLSQTLMRHHLDEVDLILEEMSQLNEDQLDAEIVPVGDTIPWDPHAPTLRGTIENIVFTEEVWLAALKALPMPERFDKPSVAGMRDRHQRAGQGLLDFMLEIEAQDLWASEFVDALCEEPVRFQFGGVFAHILVFSAHRRQAALAALRSLGREVGYGDPINWQRGEQRRVC